MSALETYPTSLDYDKVIFTSREPQVNLSNMKGSCNTCAYEVACNRPFLKSSYVLNMVNIEESTEIQDLNFIEEILSLNTTQLDLLVFTIENGLDYKRKELMA